MPKLVAINGRPTHRKDVGGYTSRGEFGNILRIFRPESEIKFQLVRWCNLRGRPTHVFSYHLDRKHSILGLTADTLIRTRWTMTAMRGFIYIDGETHQLMRIICDADKIPSDFPIQGFYTVLDYGQTEIGTEKLLLPVRSTMRVVTKIVIARNVTEFTKYRKFTSEVKIDFGKR